MDELKNLIALIERLHTGPETRITEWPRETIDKSEIYYCGGFSESLSCCIDRIRDSPEYKAAKALANEHTFA